jgi:hypothetical protein
MLNPVTSQVPAGSCFAAYIANTWGSPITITVDRGGAPFSVADFARVPSGSGTSLTFAPLPGGTLPAGQVAVLFLVGDGTCPSGVTPPMTTGEFTNGTGRVRRFTS